MEKQLEQEKRGNYETNESWDFSPVSTSNNKTQLFVDGPETLEMLISEIAKARHFINLQVMLFYSDEAGLKVAKALASKAREGIIVRVMSDSALSRIVRNIEKVRSSGSSDFSELMEEFSSSGVKFLSSNSESYFFDNWEEKRKELQNKGVPEDFLRMQDVVQSGISSDINVFDHRKLMVIDGETAIVTGGNIGNKYLYQKENDDEPRRWHTGALLIRGTCATILNKNFASKWIVRGGDLFDYKVHFRSRKTYGDDECAIYNFFPGLKENQIRQYYLDKLRTCKGRFIIENPYINDEKFWEILGELSPAQAEKIDLINPYKAKGNDYPQNESSIKCRMWKPFKKGINFYAYKKRMTHWKIALDVAASEIFMGSYNLNHRSALHDFEMNVLVKSKELSEKVMKMLQEDIEQSSRISEAEEFFEEPNHHPSCILLKATEYFE